MIYIYIRIYNIYSCMHGDRQRYDTCVFKNGGWAPHNFWLGLWEKF